jgi:hypothetical protein
MSFYFSKPQTHNKRPLPSTNPALLQNDAQAKLSALKAEKRLEFQLSHVDATYSCTLLISNNIVEITCRDTAPALELGRQLHDLLYKQLAKNHFGKNGGLVVASSSRPHSGGMAIWLQPKDKTLADESSATDVDRITEHVYEVLTDYSRTLVMVADTAIERLNSVS